MKYYLITYYLNNQSHMFSEPQKVIARNWQEKAEILKKCDDNGYVVEDIREFDPVPSEERFYA